MRRKHLTTAGSVLGLRAARRGGARPQREPSLASQVRDKTLMELIVAARRAQHAMVLEMPVPQRLALKAAEVRPEVSDEVASVGMALVRKFAGKVYKKQAAAAKKRANLLFATGENGQKNKFTQPDDAKPADPMWLQMTLTSLPALREHRVRTMLRGGKLASRGAWRRAVAQLVQKPPDAYAKLTGALMTALAAASKAKDDLRTDQGYCASPDWDRALLVFANVGSKIHGKKYCPACDGAGRLSY